MSYAVEWMSANTRANVAAWLKEIKGDAGAREEETVLKAWLKLCDRQTVLKKGIKEAEEALDLRVYEQYPGLSEAEVKVLVVEDKWLARIGGAVAGEMERVSQGLTQRVRVLAERYEVALPELTSRVAELEARVVGHLERMGFVIGLK